MIRGGLQLRGHVDGFEGLPRDKSAWESTGKRLHLRAGCNRRADVGADLKFRQVRCWVALENQQLLKAMETAVDK